MEFGAPEGARIVVFVEYFNRLIEFFWPVYRPGGRFILDGNELQMLAPRHSRHINMTIFYYYGPSDQLNPEGQDQITSEIIRPLRRSHRIDPDTLWERLIQSRRHSEGPPDPRYSGRKEIVDFKMARKDALAPPGSPPLTGERYPDLRLLEVVDGQRGAPIPQTRALMPGTYLLEVAIRGTRVGIGAEDDFDPLEVCNTTGERLLVSLLSDSKDVSLIDSIKPLFLPPSGDSTSIRFEIQVLRYCRFTLDIRFFCRLNLIEALILDVVADDAHPQGELAMKITRTQRFQRFTGDLAKALPPRTLSIQVASDGDGYRLLFVVPDMRPSDESVRLLVRPRLSAAEIEKQILALRKLWLRIALTTFGTGLDPKVAQNANEDLLDLARMGNRLWTAIFRRDSAVSNAFEETVRLALANGGTVQVNIDEEARGFVFPWSLLYDAALPEGGAEVSVDGFWGVRCAVEQIGAGYRRARMDDGATATQSMALFLNRSIGQAADQEKAIATLAGPGAPITLKAPVIENRAAFRERLAAGQDSLFYFFCHGLTALPPSAILAELQQTAKAMEASPAVVPALLKRFLSEAHVTKTDSTIWLTNSALTLPEMWEIDRVDDAVSPIVILNMCESAQSLPSLPDSFIDFFLCRPARAVLGTECLVPPDFAADFGVQLLTRLIAGEPVGAVLQALRREYLVKHRNPLGLAYSLWGSAGASLKPLNPGDPK